MTNKYMNNKISLALGLWLVAGYSAILPVNAAQTVAISNISVNKDRQLVVDLDNPDHLNPVGPQVLDFPGQQHDIVLEFPNTSFALSKIPRARTVLDELTKVFPDVKSIAYATNNDASRARIRLTISENVSTHPSLAKIDQNSVVIDLGFPDGGKKTGSVSVASAAAAESVPQSASPPAVTTNVPAATNGSAAAGQGVKDKTGLKGALNQVGKLGKIKLNPFAAKKQANPPVASADVPAATTVANADTTAKPAETAAIIPAPAAITIANADTAAKPAEAAPTNPASVAIGVPTAVVGGESAKIIAAIPTEPVGIPSPDAVASSPATAVSTTAAPAVIGADSSSPGATILSAPATVASPLKPEIGSGEQAQQPPVAPALNNLDQLMSLPRIVANKETGGADQTNLITPINQEAKTDQPHADLSASAQLPAAEKSSSEPQISTKETEGDASVVSDLKTDFAKVTQKPEAKPESDTKAEDGKQPKLEALGGSAEDGQTKKEQPTQIASSDVVKTDLPDSLNEAAAKAIAASKVQLKAMSAQKGGKDYFPPRANEEAVQHYNKAVHFHLEGKLSEAISEYRLAVVADPRLAEAHSNLGLILNQQHKYDEAMVEFHKALAINPKDAITYNGVGAAMRAQRNMLAAVRNWQTAIAMDPNLASAHYNLGTAYEMDKDLEKALVEYKEAVKHDDQLGEAYYRMGLILQKMNNRILAIEQFKQAIKVSQRAEYVRDAQRQVNTLSQKKGSEIH